MSISAQDSITPGFVFDNSYARDLVGFYSAVAPDPAPAPELLLVNDDLAIELGVDPKSLAGPAGLAMFSGNAPPEGAAPLAQAYAGHQFGGFSPQLGDGRAVLLGEVIDVFGKRRDIQLKGSGRTPFSRGGDGKAALGPVLREYLMGEAMHALGIPTTRALAAVTTGETVMREEPLRGAVLTRVAASHIRVGTFQFFAARGQTDSVRQLADYAIARHYPELVAPDLVGAEDPYFQFLTAVADAQALLIAQWIGVGFIHGVMNTDNMTISGETIDYGPCAFMDVYDPETVFSSIDTGGRYAFANQPIIAQWNLARLAEALLQLIDDDQDKAVSKATTLIEGFPQTYAAAFLTVFLGKLGIDDGTAQDAPLVNDLFEHLKTQKVDFTQFFRALCDRRANDHDTMNGLLDAPQDMSRWFERWDARVTANSDALASRNPVYIPRNHLVEEALASADAGDLKPFETLLGVLKNPFTPQEGQARFAQPAPAGFGPYKTFCGT